MSGRKINVHECEQQGPHTELVMISTILGEKWGIFVRVPNEHGFLNRATVEYCPFCGQKLPSLPKTIIEENYHWSEEQLRKLERKCMNLGTCMRGIIDGHPSPVVPDRITAEQYMQLIEETQAGK